MAQPPASASEAVPGAAPPSPSVPSPPPPPSPSPPPPPPSAPAAGARVPGQTLREIQALVDANKISAARAVAEKFLKTTPTGPEAEQIMGLTGVHPRP
jgi:hypothetical protein